jgi:predicted DNA-binding transcriptional regulator YafY
MARADRLLRLIDTMRRLPQPITAARLAAETGVSDRSLYRDIASLRASGALIDGAAGVGYTLTEDPALPPQMFTRLEVEALMLGLAEVRLSGDPDLVRAAEMAGAKITATLPERMQRQAIHAVQQTYRYEKRAPAPAHLAVIRQAAWDERALDIRYLDTADTPTQRRILPLSVIFLDRTLMCLAFCTLRQDYRRFHLHRMSDVCLTDESFRPCRVPMLRAFLAQLKGEAVRA